MNKLIFIIILLVVLACSGTRIPDSIMGKDDMVNYLIDLHLSEAAMQNLKLERDSAIMTFRIQERYILEQHNITDSTFILSYNYYLEHPIMLEGIYSAVVDSISLRQSLLNEVE